MSVPLDMLMFLGSAVCHQLPERSYSIDGVQMPLCARCIGIHFGFLLSTVFLFTGSRRFAGGMPSVRQAAVLGSIMTVFLVDALVSYSGISESDNLRRTLSGLALGIPFPFVLFPFLNSLVYPAGNPSFPLSRLRDWAALVALFILGAGAILLAESSAVLFYVVSIAGIIGVFLFFSSVLLLALVLGLERWRARPMGKAALAVASATVLLLVLAYLHGLVSDGV